MKELPKDPTFGQEITEHNPRKERLESALELLNYEGHVEENTQATYYMTASTASGIVFRLENAGELELRNRFIDAINIKFIKDVRNYLTKTFLESMEKFQQSGTEFNENELALLQPISDYASHQLRKFIGLKKVHGPSPIDVAVAKFVLAVDRLEGNFQHILGYYTYTIYKDDEQAKLTQELINKYEPEDSEERKRRKQEYRKEYWSENKTALLNAYNDLVKEVDSQIENGAPTIESIKQEVETLLQSA
jgi:hypothetical protein